MLQDTRYVTDNEGRSWLHSRALLARQAAGVLEVVEKFISQEWRVCAKCAVRKRLSDYRKMARHPGRLSRTCVVCIQTRQQEWVLKRKENSKGAKIDFDALRVCSQCREAKTAAHFHLNNRENSGLASACVDCLREKDRARYAANPELRKSQARWGGIKKKYGLTQEAWQQMFSAQNGLCGVCEGPMLAHTYSNRDKRGACVDHCHKTGRVRGLLCCKCNQGIGLLGDNADIAERAAIYLRRHQDG